MTDRTVWLISSGSYSDYSVHHAAETKEIAEQIASALNAARRSQYVDEYGVEERRLFTAMPDPWTRYVVQAKWHPDFTFDEEPHIMEHSTALWLDGSKRPEVDFNVHYRWITAAGADPDECKQAIYDRLARLKAEAANV